MDAAEATRAALKLSPAACREHALRFSWHNSAMQFLGNLVPVKARANASEPDTETGYTATAGAGRANP